MNILDLSKITKNETVIKPLAVQDPAIVDIQTSENNNNQNGGPRHLPLQWDPTHRRWMGHD